MVYIQMMARGRAKSKIVKVESSVKQPDGTYVLVAATEQLTERLQVRLSKADVRQLREAAGLSGLSVSEVVRYGIPLAYAELKEKKHAAR